MADDPTDKASGKGDSATDPLGNASDRIRESTKWLVAAFAAVGAILAAGLQLASVGRLSYHQPGRLFLAIGGALLAVGALSSIPIVIGVLEKPQLSQRA